MRPGEDEDEMKEGDVVRGESGEGEKLPEPLASEIDAFLKDQSFGIRMERPMRRVPRNEQE